ncbi:MAG: helix-turn-helix domain-containing protein [Anaerovoracaceae bacterium]
MDFRENLTRLRFEKHLTQAELAEKIGVNLDVVVQWENGDSEPPIQDLISISDALGVSVDDLLRKRENAAESSVDSDVASAGKSEYCPCCGREIKGNLCLTCEFPMTGYVDKGPRYAMISIAENGADYYDSKAELIKYCGISDEETINRYFDTTKRQVLKRNLSDVAARWIAARINPKHFSLHIVEDQAEPDEKLVPKEDAMEVPAYVYKKDNSIGVGGIILIVVLTIIVLSFL